MKLPKSESPKRVSESKKQETGETPENSPEIVSEEDPSANNDPSPPPPLSHRHPNVPGTPLNAGKVKLNFILFLCHRFLYPHLFNFKVLYHKTTSLTLAR